MRTRKDGGESLPSVPEKSGSKSDFVQDALGLILGLYLGM